MNDAYDEFADKYGLDRNEEPWHTLDGIWRKLYDFREDLLDQRSKLKDFSYADLNYLDGQLAGSSFAQKLIFTELLNFMKRNRNGNPS